MKEQIFKVVVRYEPVGDESETAVAELKGREAADGALGATDELTDGGVDFENGAVCLATPLLDVDVSPAIWPTKALGPRLANQR